MAAVDRGNYPLVSFEASDGTTSDWYPTLVALHGPERRFGWDAWDVQADESWTVIRSIKRLLLDAGPQTILDLDGQKVGLLQLLRGFAAELFSALRDRSNLRLSRGEPLQAVLGVPANANTNQRYLTIEAFRAAGFEILGVLNEPSAASIEFGHRQRQSSNAKETILVYDLGGGTFDASIVTLDENVHHVLASEGIPAIGGDDFDQILSELALEAADVDERIGEQFSQTTWFRLLEECRRKKESIHPNSRKVIIDLESVDPTWAPVAIPIADFYHVARPLVEETLAVSEDLLARFNETEIEALYVTGGGSELPLVSRVLRERFGRRVRRSAYTRSATAIGLAIQADQPEAYHLKERMTRFFGVWREADSGSQIVFDPLFEKGVELPAPGQSPLSISRTYSPAHNIGHFRFIECSHRSADGTPTGEVTIWEEIQFPFDPALKDVSDLSAIPIRRAPDLNGNLIEERYECDSGGSIRVAIANRSANFVRSYGLGRWSQKTTVKPSTRRRKLSVAKATAN